MKIHEVAKLTGVTVRTLHYYDEIGLLKPNSTTDASYRIYDNKDLEVLQQILFFRELDFPLNEIKEIMTNPGYDKDEALKKHKELLLKKRNRLDKLINLVTDTIEGGIDMSFKEFDTTDIENTKKQYAEEVKTRWGNTDAYKESEEKTKGLSKEQWAMINGEGSKIMQSFGDIRHEDPSGDAAQALVKQWQDYITKNFYKCTKEILVCLGPMYVYDERFTKNIDKYGEGTAQFMADAIEIYCSK